MKNLIIVIAVIGLVACARNMESGTALAVVNGGFEQAASDGSIPGWTTEQHAGPASYEMVVDDQGTYAGHGSFRMTRTHDEVYGALTQDIAVDKAGGVFEFSAMLRSKDVGPEGWRLMILIPRLREFSPKLVGTSDWQRVAVRATVPPGTTRVTIGVTLLDGGSGWMDDVQLKAITPRNL